MANKPQLPSLIGGICWKLKSSAFATALYSSRHQKLTPNVSKVPITLCLARPKVAPYDLPVELPVQLASGGLSQHVVDELQGPGCSNKNLARRPDAGRCSCVRWEGSTKRGNRSDPQFCDLGRTSSTTLEVDPLYSHTTFNSTDLGAVVDLQWNAAHWTDSRSWRSMIQLYKVYMQCIMRQMITMTMIVMMRRIIYQKFCRWRMIAVDSFGPIGDGFHRSVPLLVSYCTVLLCYHVLSACVAFILFRIVPAPGHYVTTSRSLIQLMIAEINQPQASCWLAA